MLKYRDLIGTLLHRNGRVHSNTPLMVTSRFYLVFNIEAIACTHTVCVLIMYLFVTEPLCDVLLHCSQVTNVLRLNCAPHMHAISWQLLLSALSGGALTLVRETRDKSVWTSSDAQLAGSYVIVDAAQRTLAICCRYISFNSMLI
jgi:hypothetical protein